MLMSKKKRIKGVTLTELLVVLAIIGLLATIAVPVYVNKMEQAKVTTAKHEVREIANAEEVCGIMHGYYVPLCMLDDLPFRSQGHTAVADDIENTMNVIDVRLISTGIPVTEQIGNQRLLNEFDEIKAISNLYYGWQGPFINFKRYYLGDGIYVEDPNPMSEDVARDHPLDPWGNPYIMVTELGAVTPRGGLGNVLITSDTDGNREFDRMAIYSLGPDGSVVSIEDGEVEYINTTLRDDIWVYFGSSGLRPETYY